MNTKKITKIVVIRSLIIIVFGLIFRFITKPDSIPNSKYQIPKDVIVNSGIQTPREINNIILTGTNTGESTSTVNRSTLTVLLPGRFYNDGFTQLAQKLKSDYNIQISYKKIDNITYYRQIIQGDINIEGIDLYLIPTDRLSNYKGKRITFDEDITPYFDPIFNESINLPDATFVPYIIDPLTVITPDTVNIDFDTKLTFQDIASFAASAGSKNKIKIPLLRGLDKNDYKLLQNGLESFPNYFIITYIILDKLYQSQNKNSFATIFDTLNNPAITKRSYASFKVQFLNLVKKNPNCILFPDICIIAYNLGDIKFGFLSDLLIQSKHFAISGQAVTNPQIYNFPILTGDYLVRGRGFVADKNTTNDENIQTFIQEYMQAGVNNSLPLRENILSAFNNILNIQKTEKKYEPLLQSDFDLIFYPADLQTNFINNTNFLQTIKDLGPDKGKNSAQEFFNQTNRTW